MRARPVCRGLALFSVGALVGALLMTSTVASAAVRCSNPPKIYPLDKVHRGLTATAWTAVKGMTPRPFQVKVLGVQRDAIAPGFDLIVIKVSGNLIRHTGGIAAGFSGSPAYHDGALVGSVSWSIDGAPKIGALTPGEYLKGVLKTGMRDLRMPDRVTLSPRLTAIVGRVSGARAAATLQQIPLPLAVSGASGAALDRVEQRFSDMGVSVVPYTAGAASASTKATAALPKPGQPVAAALSYGAISYAGVGTVTFTCGNSLVAFGHYFQHAGAGRSAAMLRADVITTVDSMWGPFKLANLGGLVGTIEQDRYAGILGTRRSNVQATTVSSKVTSLDTGKTRGAVTRVVNSGELPWITEEHVYYALSMGMDAEKGSIEMRWTVSGDANGHPFSVTMRNRYSGYIWDPSYDVYGSVRSIQRAGGHVDTVHVVATATQKAKVGTFGVTKTASTTEPTMLARRSIDVAAGDTLDVLIPMRSHDKVIDKVEASFTIGAGASRDGELTAYQARADYSLRGSLAEVLKQLAHQPGANVVFVRVRMPGAGTHVERVVLDHIVKGRAHDVRLNLV
ncbi:MAG: SpoIVB peptidase S55 domain-containing protein [Actinomycetota bacterium]